MYKRWRKILLFCCIIKFTFGELIIERRKGTTDVLIDTEGKPNTTADLKTQNRRSWCRDPDRHVILTYVDKPGTFTCISTTEYDQKTIGGSCRESIVVLDKGDAYPANCNIRRVSSVNIWTYEDLTKPWKQFDLSTSNHVRIVKKKQIEFDSKTNWEGLLVELFYTCNDRTQPCARFKFTGTRKYPLSSNLEDIFYIAESPATTTAPPSSNTGLIVGIVFGCFFILFALAILFFFVRKRKRRYKGNKKHPGSAVYGKCEFDIVTKIEYKKDDDDDENQKTKSIHQEALAFVPKETEVVPQGPDPEYRELEPQQATTTQDKDQDRYFEEPEYYSPDETLLGRPSGASEQVFHFLDNTGHTEMPEPMYCSPDEKEESVKQPVESSDNSNLDYSKPDPGYSKPERGYSKPDIEKKTDKDENTVEPEYTNPNKAFGSSLVEQAFDLKYEPNNNPDYYSTPCTNENDPLLTPTPTVEYAQVDKTKKNKAY